jgi:long-chain acyl-CoA synthetase
MLQARVLRDPDRTALWYEGAPMRASEVARIMAQAMHTARALRIGPGDVVALIGANRADYIPLVLGIAETGAAVATLNPRQTEHEFAAILADCAPRLILADALGEGPAAAAASNGGFTFMRLDREWRDMLARASDQWAPGQARERDTFAIAYTSGTTGKPKGVCLSHRSRALTALAMAVEYGCFGREHRFLSVTPLFHGAGFAYPLANLLLGGAVDLRAGAEIDALAAALAAPETTGAFVVPTLLNRLCDLPHARTRRGAGLTGLICNAAALAQTLKERTIERYGEGLLHETYGSTEAGIVSNLAPQDQLRTHNSVGRAFLGQVISLRKEDGGECAAGEPGELFSYGPYGFNGYLHNDAATREAVQDGWISVGDIAMRDERGFLHIVDRKKDMIVTGGINVYPREIEDVLLRAPGVTDAGVVGAPHADWGEEIVAFIVANDENGPPREEALLAHCAAHLAPHKRPKRIVFIEALPRNASGKVLKASLKARAAE